MRQTLRGSDNNGGNAGGYIFNQIEGGSSNYWGPMAVAQGVRGAIRYKYESNPSALPNSYDPMYANEPGEDIAYAGCHDNLDLWARILVWDYDNRDRGSNVGYLKRIHEFAYGIIYTSQGVPFL
jgi:hypothetical protein